MTIVTQNGAVRIGDVTVPGRVWLAPMTGVSDLPYRRAASRLGAPYVATEMVACELLAAGRPDVVRRAAVGEGLPLTVIQLVGRRFGALIDPGFQKSDLFVVERRLLIRHPGQAFIGSGHRFDEQALTTFSGNDGGTGVSSFARRRHRIKS